MRDIDYAESCEFLSRFFTHTVEAVEIRALPNERDAGPNRPLFTRTPAQIADHCTRWDDLERAVYFGVATRQAGAGKGDRAHCRELPAIWADIDTVKLGLEKDYVVKTLQQELEIPPSVIIDSGGGIHAYWMLREPIDITIGIDGWEDIERRVSAVLKQLCGILAGDPTVCELARIMRLPGTHNTKSHYDKIYPVKIIDASWQRIEFDDIVEMLDRQRPVLIAPLTNGHAAAQPVETDPYLVASKLLSFKPPLDVEQRLAAMAYLGNGDNGIHQTQLSVSASLVSQGEDDDKIVESILAATHAAAGQHGLTWNWEREEAAIRKMIASAKAKAAPDGPWQRPSATVHRLHGGGPKPASPPIDDPEDDPIPAPDEQVRNDIGNAHALIAKHGPNLRYVIGMGWHVWDGKRYASDSEGILAQRMAHDVSADMLMSAASQPASKARTNRIKWAIQSGNKSRIGAMLDQARSYIHSRADDLDRDPMLLNCTNGTVDLNDLELRPHQQSDLLTKLCTIDYDPHVKCPIWERFISEIFDEDRELIEFVQRAIGYSMTARTDEQVIFIMHGAGSNGKSVLLETVAAILGNYVERSPSETWVSKPTYSGPSNDIAALAGARFVSIIETEHDKHLAEALVKQATGGDTMTARFLHKEFFSFSPKFKLWLATNHKPKIRGSDYAIWRRIILIPFLVTFVDASELTAGQKVKDPDLKSKLATEYPGILAWMIRGCAAWLTLGLTPPAAVRNATESYQDAEDNVSAFVRDTCHLSRGLTCQIGILYAAYEIWCEENDEEARSKRAFGQTLDDRGFPPGPRTNRNRLRKGIDLKEEYRESAEYRNAHPKGGQ